MLLLIVAICCQVGCRVIEQSNDYLKLELTLDYNEMLYTAEVLIGNPPQRQLLSIDTGSSYLLVKSQGCESCTKASLPFYSKAASQTYQRIDCKRYPIKCHNLCPRNQAMQPQCNFRKIYGTSNYILTFQGIVGNDQIRFSDAQEGDSKQSAYRREYLVAVIQKQFSNQNRVYDNGIMGLNTLQEGSLMYDWFRLNNLQHSRMKLAICLQEKRGYMEWGNFSNQGSSSVLYDYRSGQYLILVDSITIKGESLLDPLAIFTTIIVIDSGSSGCSFPEQEHNKIASIVNEKCAQLTSCKPIDFSQNIFNRASNTKNYCYGFTSFMSFSFHQYLDDQFAAIKIKLNGTYFNLHPSKYFRLVYEDYTGYKAVCLDIMSSPEKLYILGKPWMANKKITFNLDPSHPIIFIADYCQCFDWLQQLQIKFSKGWIGYLLTLLFFLFALCRARIHNSIRQKKEAHNNSQMQFVGTQSFK